MNEKFIEKKLVEAVRKAGGLAPKFVSPGLDGMPDRIVLLPASHMAFVELKAEWKFKGEKHLRKEQMERTNLSNKCGSCKYFTEMPSLTSRCYGKCEKGRAGYKPRSCKACKLYERRIGEE